jgi:hypothetical protein
MDFDGIDSDVLPMPQKVYHCRIFDRRRPELRFRISYYEHADFADFENRQITDLVISNPASKIQFPVWEPKPLPQVRRLGEVDVVLRGLTFSPVSKEEENVYRSLRTKVRKFKLVEKVEVLRQGKPIKGLELGNAAFADATGNWGLRYMPLPSSERAWKVMVDVTRTGDFPFSEKQEVFLEPVRHFWRVS